MELEMLKQMSEYINNRSWDPAFAKEIEKSIEEFPETMKALFNLTKDFPMDLEPVPIFMPLVMDTGSIDRE
ncbi:hypothetical protein JOD43_002793 [Pullulanibacillus pueri]|uniref:Uncharacterized protein n=1 Tax=Pullulanibacillus pueri TaxID=1437324 RepID=A0A8J2ZW69_9BACL|nr:hypothetical protein [Pullulanibacillus pueri]MBM7682614.1 hypothetical protein [Pullulanibacillus pueri]GGH82513.1 hypothetical protein GCM10007096_22010 [Pullulanibacillus pueri]